MTIYYVNPINGADANDGLTWATAWRTLNNGPTSARLGTSDTDEIRIAKSPDPISLGNVTWTHNASADLTVSSLSNLLIDDCESGWTAGLVTPTYTSSFNRSGTNSMQTVLSSTNGKVCFKTLTSTDYSSFSRITFWVNFGTSVNYTAGCPIQIRLCSDTDGNTAVNTFTLPSYFYGANYWNPITIDNVSNLGSNIQSIAIFTTSAVTATVRFDNITVARSRSDATSLVLTDLIAKNNGNGEYFPIQSINGTTVNIACPTSNTATRTTGSPLGFYFSINGTETIDTVKRECFITAAEIPGIATNTTILTINSASSGIDQFTKTYKGGYNTTTTEIDGETWFDGITGYGDGISIPLANGANWNTSDISIIRYQLGVNIRLPDNGGINRVSSINNVRTYSITWGDRFATRQNQISSPIIDFKWIYSGVGASTNTSSIANSSGQPYVYMCLPNLRPTFNVVNCFNRSTSNILNSNTGVSLNFYSTGTLITNSGGTFIFENPQRGVVNVNNILFINQAAVTVFQFGRHTYSMTLNCDGAPSRIVKISGKLEPAASGVTGSNAINFTSMLGVNGNILIEGVTSNAAFNPNASFYSWRGFAEENGGILTIKNVKTSITLIDGLSTASNDGYPGMLVFENYNQTSTNRMITLLSSGSGSVNNRNYWENQTSVTYAGTSAWRKFFFQSLGPGAGVPDQFVLGSVAVGANTQVTMSIRIRRTTLNAYGYILVEGGYAGISDTGVFGRSTGAIDTWELVTITFTPTTTAVIPIQIGVVGTTTAVQNHSVYFDDLQITQA